MDLELISGAFFYDDIVPKDKRYLFKYFSGDPQRRFVAYAFTFEKFRDRHGSYKFCRGFVDHTGFQVTRRVIFKWLARIRDIEAALSEATKAFDMQTIETIRTGKFRFRC